MRMMWSTRSLVRVGSLPFLFLTSLVGEDKSTWTATAAWGTATAVLIVVTLTLDPLWAYWGAWTSGLMTAYSAIRATKKGMKRWQQTAQDDALLLEVRQARTEEVEKDADDVEH
jgi:hypothetical protein